MTSSLEAAAAAAEAVGRYDDNERRQQTDPYPPTLSGVIRVFRDYMTGLVETHNSMRQCQ